MRDAAVDDVRVGHAAVDRVQARLQLGPHAAGDRAERGLDLVRGGLADHGRRVIGVAQPADDVGEEHDLVGPEGAGHGAGGLVGVDVVGVAFAVGADRRHDRDVVLGDVVEHIDVDAIDLAHEADVLALGAGLAAGAEELPVVAAQADRRLAVAVEAQDDVLVDLADEDHLRHLDGLGVGDPKSADELHRQPEALHVGGDLGPAAVHDDRVEPDVLEQHDVAGELLAQRRVLHRGAAVLDDDRLAVELPDVRERLEQCPDVAHQVVYSALIVTYSWLRSEKKTSVSAPSPGRSTTYSTSSPATFSASSAWSKSTAAPRAQTRTPSIVTSTASGAVSGRAMPTDCTIRPQLGSPPCRAALTSGELATARAASSTAGACPPRTTTRPTRLAPSPSRTMLSASWRKSASSAWPKRSSPSDSGSTATPLSPEHMRITVSLVDSCPSTEMRSNERLTHTPSRRSAVSADSSASVCTKHSSVANDGWIMPAPLACAQRRTVPPGRSTASVARFSKASVVMIAAAKSASPSGRSSRRAPARPLTTACESSGTPMTPVEATATRSASTLATIAPAPCILAASSGPRPPVAALALPELATTARMAPSFVRSWVRSTGAARTPDRVNRAALVVSGASDTSSATSLPPLGLIPAATPAARKPAGSPPSGSSRTPSGTSIQREEKKRLVACSLKAAPSSRRNRTSG